MTDNTWDEAKAEHDKARRRRDNPERAQGAGRRFRRHARDLGLSPKELKRAIRQGDAPARHARAGGWDAWDANWNKVER